MKAIYAFSGDPITLGHIDIIKRANKIFDTLIVGIGVNPSKNYTFTLEERIKMAEESLKHLKKVKVIAFEGLLVDYAYENNIGVIIRGIRNNRDFEYEFTLHLAGRTQELGIETFPLFAKPEYSYISSSLVKELVKEQGKITKLVPLCVKEKLERKILDQSIISITGSIGVGKSYVSKSFVEYGKKYNIPVHNIDLDIISHEILGTLTEPIYKEIRKKLVERFGDSIQHEDTSIDRSKLGSIVFKNKESLEYLNELMAPAIYERMRKEMYNKKGIILINAALLVENGYLDVSNNNVVIIDCNSDVQCLRLKERGYLEEDIENRIKSQISSSQKIQMAERIIRESDYGKIFKIDTSSCNDNEIEKCFLKLLKYFNR